MNTATKKILILSSGILFIATSLAAGSWWWEEKRGAELVVQMQTLRDQSLLESKHKALRAEWEKVTVLREYLDGLVIEGDKDTIGLLSSIDSLAAANGVSVATGDLRVTETEEEGFDFLTITLNLKGGQNSVLQMLKILETLPYASATNRVSLSRAGGTAEAQVVLQVSIKE